MYPLPWIAVEKVYFPVNEPKEHWCLAQLEIRTGVGISADHYKITYNYASVPFQASLYGDCGIWVCIFIYRLCRNLPMAVDKDPLETVLAYRERMLEFFWNHKILVE
ncbi:phospholipase-like protein [Tanacetum coccineum]